MTQDDDDPKSARKITSIKIMYKGKEVPAKLVGIPIGRMQGDYRFSFILPIRAEMLRKLPVADTTGAVSTDLTEQHSQ